MTKIVVRDEIVIETNIPAREIRRKIDSSRDGFINLEADGEEPKIVAVSGILYIAEDRT